MSNSEKGWSDYWEKDSAEGEVFVNAQGGGHPALAEFWRQQFDGVPDRSRVVDLASGAGSVFGHLPVDRDYQLFAADISPVALKALEERFSNVETIVCSADQVPFDDESFDIVVSQFGVEYAGISAFEEAARLIASNGYFIALSHIEDGYIDHSNKAQLREAKLLAELGFIDKANSLIVASTGLDPAALQSAEREFVTVAKQVGDGIARCKKGIHTHLFFGFRELYEKRQQYDLSDITGWLDGMRGELDMNIDRLSRMCAAALSEDDINVIKDIFVKQGIEEVDCIPYEVPGNKRPVAWKLTAHKRRKCND